jgi:hypothetical protein
MVCIGGGQHGLDVPIVTRKPPDCLPCKCRIGHSASWVTAHLCSQLCDALNDLSESLPPGRMKGTPVEFPPRLGVRSRARLRHHSDEVLAGRQASDPCGHAERRLCAEHCGGRGKPFVNRRGIVVDDIVDASSEFDRQGGCLRRVIDLQERPPRGAPADEWHAAAADLLDQRRIEHAGVGPVECAVA